MKNLFKHLPRALALLLAVIMVAAAFAACNNKPSQPEPTEAVTEAPTEVPTEAPTPEPTEAPTPEPASEAMLYGAWETEINIAETTMKAFAEDTTGMFSGIELSDAFITLRLVFNEDGTYSVDADPESYKAAMKQMVDEMVPALKELMIAMLSAFAEEGQELTEEDMLALLEIDSWDELGEQMLGDIDAEDDEFSSKGMYELREDKLYMSDGEGVPVDDSASIVTITLTADELTFVSAEGDSEDSLFSNPLMPMVFKKVN